MKKFLNRKNLYSYLKVYIPLLIVFCIVSVLIFSGVRNQSQAFHFEDETDHLTMGWMMHRYDKTLYKDLSLNHQPIPVFFGALFTKIIPFFTLFELVERVRISMFLFGAICGLVATLRFKWKGLFSFGLFYATGYYFFAWHVLAESLAAPVVLILFLIAYEKCFLQRKTSKFTQVFDSILIGTSLSFVVNSLLPLWPFCLLVFIGLFLFSTAFERKLMIISGVIATIIPFLFFSPIDWYRETVQNNLLYFLPYAPKPTFQETLRIIFFPFVSVLKPMDRLSQIFLTPLLFACVLVAAKVKKKLPSKRVILTSLYFYILLISTNSRVFTFPNAFYSGFHLYPFVAGFFALVTVAIWHLLNRFSPKKNVFIFSSTFFALLLFALSWARKDVDKLNEYYVQHGTQDSYARLLIQFKQPNDAFYSGPNGFGYINIRTDLPIAGRQLFHLQWAYLSPQLRGEFHKLIAETPPAFVLLYDDESGYHTDMQPFLKSQYTEIIQDKHRTFLYFRNDRVQQTTPAQQTYLTENDFHFRTAEEVEIY